MVKMYQGEPYFSNGDSHKAAEKKEHEEFVLFLMMISFSYLKMKHIGLRFQHCRFINNRFVGKLRDGGIIQDKSFKLLNLS